MADQTESVSPKPRGFAAMSEEKRLATARKGGRAAQARGTAHRWESGSQEAQAAGRRGGAIVSADKEHMATIGRVGGGAPRQSKQDTD